MSARLADVDRVACEVFAAATGLPPKQLLDRDMTKNSVRAFYRRIARAALDGELGETIERVRGSA